MPTYTPPPDVVDLGPNEYRAASLLSLTCMVEGATGTVSYDWTSTLPAVDGMPQTRTRNILRPADTGMHTCTATDDDSGETGMASIEVIVVGELP